VKHGSALIFRVRPRYTLAAAAVCAMAAALFLLGVLQPDAKAQGGQAFISYACADSSADATSIGTDLSSLQEGGTLLLSGTCDAGAITVPSDITLEGTEGSDSNVGTQVDGNLTETSSESTTIRDLQVNCGGSGAGIQLDGWQDTVTGVTVTDCVDGIELYSAGGSGNHVNDRITNNFIQGTSQYGFYVDDGGNGITDGFFTGNYVADGTTAIYMTNAAGWYIEDNHIYGESGSAIYADRMWGTKIDGNYIENWTGYGIEGSVQSGAVASVVADNNVFESDGGSVGSGGSAGSGIFLSANGSSDCFAAVTGNTVISTSDASGSYGIEGYGAGLTFSSSGNLVEGAATASGATDGATKTSGV
jgi:Periplasmic copper-binding protein (NosD)